MHLLSLNTAETTVTRVERIAALNLFLFNLRSWISLKYVIVRYTSIYLNNLNRRQYAPFINRNLKAKIISVITCWSWLLLELQSSDVWLGGLYFRLYLFIYSFIFCVHPATGRWNKHAQTHSFWGGLEEERTNVCSHHFLWLANWTFTPFQEWTFTPILILKFRIAFNTELSFHSQCRTSHHFKTEESHQSMRVFCVLKKRS